MRIEIVVLILLIVVSIYLIVQENRNKKYITANKNTQQITSSGKYIIGLTRNDNITGYTKGILAEHNIKCESKYKETFKGFSANLSKEQLERLQEDKRVENIFNDHDLKIQGNFVGIQQSREVQSWGIPRIGGFQSVNTNDVEVYVIDTGIQLDHPDLNVVDSINFVPSEPATDTNGHGTHVAGIIGAKYNGSLIVGMLPGVKLISVKVIGASGYTSISTIIKGLEYVYKRKIANPKTPMVVNMSLGGYVGTSNYDIFDLTILKLINKGINVVVASGNETDDASLYSPAHIKEAITVAAYDINNTSAYFTNYGNVVDIYSPGVNIVSTFKNSSLAIMSGTSMACPFVTGIIAYYLTKYPYAHSSHIKKMLQRDIKTIDNPMIKQTPSLTINKSIHVKMFM